MRSRNQSKRPEEEDPSKSTLNNISREGVGRILKRANSRGSSRVKRQDNRFHCFESDATPETGLTGKGKEKVNTKVTCSTLESGSILPEKNVEERSTFCDFPDKKEDTDESDWEDGYISVSDSRDQRPVNQAREVIVEFSDSPSSTKQKPIRRTSAEDKVLAELVHKAHLLCLLARGRLIDSACNDPLIQASLISLLPTHLLKIGEVGKLTANALCPIVNWFFHNFHVKSPSNTERSFRLNLAFVLEKHEGTAEEVSALSVALFRALNLTTRFVSILDVASLKPDMDMSGCSSQDATRAETSIFNSSTLMVAKSNQVSVSPAKSSSHKAGFSKDIIGGTSHRGAHGIKESRSACKTGQPKCSQVAAIFNDKRQDPLGRNASNDTSEASPTKKAEGSKRRGDLEYELQLEMALASTAAGVRDGNSGSKLKDLPSSSSHLSSPFRRLKRIKSEESPLSPQGISIAVGSRKVGAPLYWAEVFCSGENLTGKWVHVDAVHAIIDGEEKVEAAAAACRRSLRYVIAFAGHGAKDVTRRYCMKWYKIASKRISSTWWDAVLAPLKELETAATAGIVHLEANPENTSSRLDKVKALKKCNSVEGCMNENPRSSSTQESLPGQDGLTEKSGIQVSKQHGAQSSLRNGVATRNSLEEMELQTRALTEPLPTNQQAYKNHHLYAIERWLTKYQILHPKGPILGYCSGHPVYPRHCVQTLHTKQRWLREGLQVNASESPAKVVKRSSKLGKGQASEPGVNEENEGEGNIALYGRWQTEPLDLPHATNGIVPKNERGQVDVWSEKCLPHGTVHLRLPRVFTVAKRLGVDYAPAMVGFEIRNGCSVPVYEGIVVCTEFKDAIMEAYAEEEERRDAKEKKRNEIQAISRWYQLLSSIITRQRLNQTYGDESSSQISHVPSRKDADVNGAQIAKNGDDMPSNEHEQGYIRNSRSDLTEDHEHIFPIENQSFDEESSVRTKRCPCGFSVQVEEL